MSSYLKAYFRNMKHALLFLALLTPILFGSQALAGDVIDKPVQSSKSYSSIYWSDGDSGKVGDIKFRLANIDAPETGSLKQRGGAKCEAEREIGYEAKAFLVEFTRDKEIKIVRDYGKDRYDRLVVDLTAEDIDIARAAVEAGHLKPWLHKKGRALGPKPDWCAR